MGLAATALSLSREAQALPPLPAIATLALQLALRLCVLRARIRSGLRWILMVEFCMTIWLSDISNSSSNSSSRNSKGNSNPTSSYNFTNHSSPRLNSNQFNHSSTPWRIPSVEQATWPLQSILWYLPLLNKVTPSRHHRHPHFIKPPLLVQVTSSPAQLCSSNRCTTPRLPHTTNSRLNKRYTNPSPRRVDTRA